MGGLSRRRAAVVEFRPVAAAAERVYGTLPHQDDADQQTIGTGADAAWRAELEWLRAGILLALDADLLGLRHGLRRDQQRVRAEQCRRAGAARIRAGLSRRRGGGRAAGRAGGTRGPVGRRLGRGRRGRPGVRPQRHAAVAGGTGRRRRLPRLCRRQEIGQPGRARGSAVHAARPRQPRRQRRPAGRGADAGPRALSAACPLRPPAVREPDRARRTTGPLRHAGTASAGARHRAGGRPAAGRSERARGVLPGRHAARRGPDAAAAGPRRHADPDQGLRCRRSLHRRAGTTDRAGLAARRRAARACRPERRAAAPGARHRAA